VQSCVAAAGIKVSEQHPMLWLPGVSGRLSRMDGMWGAWDAAFYMLPSDERCGYPMRRCCLGATFRHVDFALRPLAHCIRAAWLCDRWRLFYHHLATAAFPFQLTCFAGSGTAGWGGGGHRHARRMVHVTNDQAPLAKRVSALCGEEQTWRSAQKLSVIILTM
jgi:hypothetical protein